MTENQNKDLEIFFDICQLKFFRSFMIIFEFFIETLHYKLYLPITGLIVLIGEIRPVHFVFDNKMLQNFIPGR